MLSTATQNALNGKANTSHSHAVADVTGLQTTLDGKAPLASPALTGTPTAPSAAAYADSTQIILHLRFDQLRKHRRCQQHTLSLVSHPQHMGQWRDRRMDE